MSRTISKLKFISSRRKETIKEWKDWQATTYTNNSRHTMLPMVVTDWTKSIIEQHCMFRGSRNGQYVDYKGNRVKASFGSQTSAKKISKEKAKDMLPTLGMLNPKYKQQIKELIGDFYFDTITAFSDNKVLEPVYDLTTTAGQFTGNGIVVHNCQAFPFAALSAWTPDAGCVMYKTWNGKPVHEEHFQNTDYTKAKGIILSTILRPIKNTSGDIWKVIKLVAFDRNRDSVLANEILAGRRNAWSMGAYARSYTCSICASDISKQCGHLVKDKPEYKLYNGKLAYWNVVDPYGFEISNVKSPAFASAKDTKYFTMDSIRE